MEKFAKLASLGALGVAAGTVALFPLFVWAFSPTVTGGAPGARGGIDHVGWYVLMVATSVPIAILAGAHIAFARQLKAGPRPI
jgi:hypothetical protein